MTLSSINRLKQLAPIAVAAIVLAVYWQSAFFGFSYLDDDVIVLDNNHVLRDAGSIPRLFATDVFMKPYQQVYYRPVMNLSLMIDAHLGGTSPVPYHVTNIIIHAMAAVALYYLLLGFGLPFGLSFFFTSVFSVHPALSQAVSWVPGRNDSLLGLFVILSFLSFMDWTASGKGRSLLLHTVFLLLALFTKETAAILLVICPLYSLLFGKWDRSRATVLLPWAGAFLIWIFARQSAFSSAIPYLPSQMLASVNANLPALLVYLGKIFFPLNLTVMPLTRTSTLLYGLVALSVMISVLALAGIRDRKMVIFGAVWFVLFLLPVLVTEFILEHRNYLPIIGIMLMFSGSGLVRPAKDGPK